MSPMSFWTGIYVLSSVQLLNMTHIRYVHVPRAYLNQLIHTKQQNILPETQYVESQLACLRDKFVDDADLEALISSGSVPVVDAMLYLLPYTGND